MPKVIGEGQGAVRGAGMWGDTTQAKEVNIADEALLASAESGDQGLLRAQFFGFPA